MPGRISIYRDVVCRTIARLVVLVRLDSPSDLPELVSLAYPCIIRVAYDLRSCYTISNISLPPPCFCVLLLIVRSLCPVADDGRDCLVYHLHCTASTDTKIQKTSESYNPARLLSVIPSHFLEEHALLLSRLGRHQEVLNIYVSQVRGKLHYPEFRFGIILRSSASFFGI